MKNLVYLCAVLIAAVAAALAGAYAAPLTLSGVASRFAQRPVEVRCYEPGERTDDPRYFDPSLIGAWGYVWIGDNVENMAPEVCEGALAIADPASSVAAWKQALGALVIAHESYHLRLNLGNRGNEAATECRAIRHFKYTVQFLGGSPSLAERLLPYALSIHWRIAARYPEYYQESCVVPNYWPPSE